MANTRNYNMKSDYCLHEEAINNQAAWLMDTTAVFNCHSAIPCTGINPQQLPRTILSKNSVDVESNLFGIGSTNHVHPPKPMAPEKVSLPSVKFYDYVPLMIPKVPKQTKPQRPFPI